MSERPARRRGRLLVTLLVAVVGVVGASLPLFVLPRVDTPAAIATAGVDAVVVLGGGPGDRLGTALVLVASLPEPPPVLVLSVPYGAPLVGCGTAPGLPRVPVTCLTPDPPTTAGEAATTVALARTNGWEQVLVVTSDFHVTRSRMLFEACAENGPPVELLWAAAETEPLSLHGAFAVATEWPSLLGTRWDHEPACRAPSDEG